MTQIPLPPIPRPTKRDIPYLIAYVLIIAASVVLLFHGCERVPESGSNTADTAAAVAAETTAADLTEETGT